MKHVCLGSIVLLAGAAALSAQPAPRPAPGQRPQAGQGVGGGGGGGRGAGGQQGRRGGGASEQPEQYRPEDLCTVTGSVVNASTGEGVAKAMVTLSARQNRFGNDRAFAATTDAAGRFEMKGVEPGQYRMTVERNGFVRGEYGSRAPGRPGTTVTLQKAQTLSSADIKLTPHAVVSGRITDSDGEPLARISVQVLRLAYTPNGKQLMPVAMGETNDLGEYRVFGLAPGKYVLSASPRNGFRSQVVDASSRAAAGQGEDSLAQTYFPGTTDASQATTINVPVGAQLQGADMRLQRVRTYRVSGQVAGAASDGRGGMLMLLPRNGGGAGFLMNRTVGQWRRDGTFDLRGVAPGSYILAAEHFNPGEGGGQRLSARVPVDLGDGHVSGVQVALQPAFEVSGTLKWEGGAPETQSGNVQISAQREGGSMPMGPGGGGGSGQVREDNTFTIRQMASDNYTLAVSGLPGNYYVKSIRVGQVDALTAPAAMMPGVTVEVVASADGATMSGTTNNEKGNPVPATVLLIPVSQDGQPPARHLIRTATASQTGAFSISGIAPGDYQLVALEDYEPGAATDPDFVKSVERIAQKVTLRAKGAETKTLKAAAAID